MKQFTAKMTCSFHSGRKFCISVEDRSSGVRVCTMEMEPEAFALMLAGHAYQDGTAQLIDSYDAVGKSKEMRTAALEDRSKWNALKYASKGAETADLAELHEALLATAPAGEGWAIWCDGTTSQQNGTTYNGTLYRYVETPPAEAEGDDELTLRPMGGTPFKVTTKKPTP